MMESNLLARKILDAIDAHQRPNALRYSDPRETTFEAFEALAITLGMVAGLTIRRESFMSGVQALIQQIAPIIMVEAFKTHGDVAKIESMKSQEKDSLENLFGRGTKEDGQVS